MKPYIFTHLIRIFLLTTLIFSFSYSYEITSWSFNSGSTYSHSSTYDLQGTLGQSFVGLEQTSSNMTLESGFWAFDTERQMCLVPILNYLLN